MMPTPTKRYCDTPCFLIVNWTLPPKWTSSLIPKHERAPRQSSPPKVAYSTRAPALLQPRDDAGCHSVVSVHQPRFLLYIHRDAHESQGEHGGAGDKSGDEGRHGEEGRVGVEEVGAVGDAGRQNLLEPESVEEDRERDVSDVKQQERVPPAEHVRVRNHAQVEEVVEAEAHAVLACGIEEKEKGTREGGGGRRKGKGRKERMKEGERVRREKDEGDGRRGLFEKGGEGVWGCQRRRGMKAKKQDTRRRLALMLHDWHSFEGLRFSHSAGRQAGTRVA